MLRWLFLCERLDENYLQLPYSDADTTESISTFNLKQTESYLEGIKFINDENRSELEKRKKTILELTERELSGFDNIIKVDSSSIRLILLGSARHATFFAPKLKSILLVITPQ